MSEPQWLWVCRWEEFQHYAPERDRAPAWVKTYTKQLDDDRYTDLSPRARSLLHDLRMAFARTSYQLRTTPGTLSARVMQRVYTTDLESLIHAGFIEIVSRETLERRLEKVYASRAPARLKEEEREEEVEETPKGVSSSTTTRSEETPTPHQPVNGRAALPDDIPLPNVKTPPTFPCPHCDHVDQTWSGYTLHLTLDHPEVPA